MTGFWLPMFVLVPLVAAAVAALAEMLRQGAFERWLMVTVPTLVTVGGGWLLATHAGEPVIGHNVGGFLPGIAIPLVSDTLTALMLTVTGLTSAVCAVFLTRTHEARLRFVPALVLMLVAGVNGAVLTGDLFNLFVFVEVMLLPSYALIAVTGTWRRLGVGRMFVVVNLLTSTLLLIGVGGVYAGAGAVNLAALAGAGQDPWVALACGVVLLALAIKAGVAPAHGWLARAYPGTSAGVMALFSAVHSKVAVYAIYRIYSVVYEGESSWMPLLVVLVAATIVVGAWSGLGEQVARRFLVFQMVTGIGHILVGVALFTHASLAAGIFYLLHHVLVMGSLLLTMGAVEQTYGSGRYDRISGLMRREPLVTWVVALGLLSLAGLPPSSGFVGKVGLVIAAAAADASWHSWLLVAAIVVAAGGTLLSGKRLWSRMCWGPPMETYRPDSPETGRAERTGLPADVRVPRALLAPGAALLLVSLGLFALAGPVGTLVQQAAAGLTDTTAYVQAVLP